MTTILDTLKAVSSYPIPSRVFDTAAVTYGIDLTEEARKETLILPAYLYAKADVYFFLSTAPAYSELGVSHSLSDSDKAYFRREANKIISGIEGKPSSGYGYYQNGL